MTHRSLPYLLAIALSSAALPVEAQRPLGKRDVDAPKQKPQKTQPQEQASTQGMVIAGDREAPLVLYVVPWQEPKPVPPRAAERSALIPNVYEDLAERQDPWARRLEAVRE